MGGSVKYVPVPVLSSTGTVATLLWESLCSNPRQVCAHRLHGLDLLTGVERPGSAVVAPSIATPKFDPTALAQRAGLALLNNVVLIGFGSNFGSGKPFNGWLLSYSIATTPYSLAGQLDIVQTGTGTGGGVWMSGALRGGTNCPCRCNISWLR